MKKPINNVETERKANDIAQMLVQNKVVEANEKFKSIARNLKRWEQSALADRILFLKGEMQSEANRQAS